LWPGRLSAALAAIGRRPLLRTVELLLFNVCATIVLAERALRAYYAGSGQGFFGVQHEHPFTRKLVNPLFGAAPNALGYSDDEFSVEMRNGSAITSSRFAPPATAPIAARDT
jgi:hypothetical protein